MTWPLVTVLVPTHDRAHFLEAALASALGQTIPCEVLVYDDGSTDRTPALVRELQTRHPGRIRYLRGEGNRGVGHARNRLLEEVGTAWACWLDSDDVMPPRRLELQLGAALTRKLEIVWSAYRRFERMGPDGPVPTGRPVPPPDLARWRDQGWRGLTDNVTNPTALFARSLARFSFPTEVHWGGEDSVWSYAVFRSGARIGVVEEPVYWLRRHPGRISVRKRARPEAKARESEVLRRWIEAIDADPTRPVGARAP